MVVHVPELPQVDVVRVAVPPAELEGANGSSDIMPWLLFFLLLLLKKMLLLLLRVLALVPCFFRLANVVLDINVLLLGRPHLVHQGQSDGVGQVAAEESAVGQLPAAPQLQEGSS